LYRVGLFCFIKKAALSLSKAACAFLIGQKSCIQDVFLNLIVFSGLGEHVFQFLVLFYLLNVPGELVFTIGAILLASDRFDVNEYHLGDPAPHDQRHPFILGTVGELHGPAVEKSDIFLAGALFADIHEVATHGGAGFHVAGNDAVMAADVLNGMAKDRTARRNGDDQVVR